MSGHGVGGTESLLMRNEKLARECSRLKNENRSLKIFLRKLLKQELNLKIDEGKSVEDKAVQTETSKAVFKERMIRQSPPLTNVTSISEWLELQSPKSSLRSPSSMSLHFFDDKENPAPPLPKTFSDIGRMPSPYLGGHTDMKVVTPSTDTKGPRPGTPLKTPPKSFGKTSGLAEKASARTPEMTRLESAPTPQLMSMSASREPRAVSRVGSYKEPSLKAKVRKGFKFFQFLSEEK